MKFIFILSLISMQSAFTMAQAAQIGVQILAASAAKVAEVKNQTEGYKAELVMAQKAITSLVDKEKVKNHNLEIISAIKNNLIQKISLNNNKNELFTAPLIKIADSSYKKLIDLANQFKRKISSEKKNISLYKIAFLVIKTALTGYISFLQEYNIELQSISQSIQTNNQFNSVYSSFNSEKNFIDTSFDFSQLPNELEIILSNTDKTADIIKRSMDLFLADNHLLFNKQTEEILNTINSIEKKESNKNINDNDEVFYDLEDSFNTFKDSLFSALDNLEQLEEKSEGVIYKIIASLDIASYKIQSIFSSLISSNEGGEISIEGMIKNLNDNLEKNKILIKKNKETYIQSLLRDTNSQKYLLNELKKLFFFLEDNINKLDYSSLIKYSDLLNSLLIKYQNAISLTNKTANSDFIYFTYINNFLIDLKNGVSNFNKGIKNKFKNYTPTYNNFKAEPVKSILNKAYSFSSKSHLKEASVKKIDKKNTLHSKKSNSVQLHSKKKVTK